MYFYFNIERMNIQVINTFQAAWFLWWLTDYHQSLTYIRTILHRYGTIDSLIKGISDYNIFLYIIYSTNLSSIWFEQISQ